MCLPLPSPHPSSNSNHPIPTRSWFFPGPGVVAAAADAGTAATIGIFIISGLLLQKGESLAAIRSTAAVTYGLTAILAITPLLAFAILRLPLRPREMALGLAVFACMPTTLSANVTLTTAASGNTAVALLLTVASNTLAVSRLPAWWWLGEGRTNAPAQAAERLRPPTVRLAAGPPPIDPQTLPPSPSTHLCSASSLLPLQVFTIPAMLSLVLGSGAAGVAAFDAAHLFRNLLKTVLLPLMTGAALQAVVPGARWAG